MNTEHIVKSFDEDLKKLDNTIAEMGGLAEVQLADAIEALIKRDTELADRVIAGDKKIDMLEADNNAMQTAIHTELESAEQLPLERYIPRLVMGTRPRVEWEQDVVGRMRTLEQFTNEDARVQMLRLLRALPYGQSTFFTCKRIEDPIGLLPGKLILGINRRGVHFFRPVPKEYLHTAELRDIMQFGSSASAVFFKMRVAGQLHIFQFETKQGEEICLALQTHINDVMMKRYAKKKEAAQAARKDGDGAADAGAAAQAALRRAGLECAPRRTLSIERGLT